MKFNLKTKKTFVILFLITSIAIMAGAGLYLFLNRNTAEKENAQYQEAKALYEAREYSQAVAKYKESINADSSLTKSYIEASDILLQKDSPDAAIELLKKGEGFAIDQARLLNKIANIYADQADFANASDYAKKAASNNGSFEYKRDEAAFLILNGEIDEGKNKAKGLGTGGNAESYFVSAIANFEDIDKAKELANKAYEISQEEKYKRLLSVIDEAIATQDNQIEDYMNIAQVAINYEEYAFVLPITQFIRNENGYYEGSFIYEAFVLQHYKAYTQAQELLKTASLYAPNNADVYKILAKCQYETNSLVEAEDSIKKAMKYGDNSEIYEIAMNIYIDSDNFESALAAANQILLTDTSFEFQEEKAFILFDLARYSEVINHTQALLDGRSLTMEQEVALEALQAFAHYKLNEKSQARDILSQAEEKFSKNPTLLYVLANFYQGQDDNVLAQEYFKKAEEYDINGFITNRILEEGN